MATSSSQFSINMLPRRSSRGRRFDTSTSTSTSLDDLPEPLLVEFLIRLPCKSCFKCKVVSKRWLSLISQPHFIRQFIYRHVDTKNPSFIYEYADTKKKPRGTNNLLPLTFISRTCNLVLTDPVFKSSGFHLDFLPCFGAGGSRSVFVVASSKDLLLCSSKPEYQKSYYICNPLTQKWIRLPSSRRSATDIATGFITEPFYHHSGDEGTVDLGTGFSFKVIRFLLHRGSNRLEVEIFSSEIGKWGKSFILDQSSYSYRTPFYNLGSIFSNCGMLHWWSE